MDKRQNEAVEQAARDAASGKKRYDWRRTAIYSSDGGVANVTRDLSAMSGPAAGRWWEHREPEFLRKQGKGIARNVGLDLAYCAEPISENIAETPEGYWICRNVTIGRSGFQRYKVSEIADPEGLLGDDYAPDDELQLWRDPSEVFSPATIASFEGKSVTVGHPRELLNPDTDTDHAVGHVQNIHKGREPLDSGDWPLLGDLVIKDAEAIDAIKSGECELSSGYTYRLAKEGHRWDQRDILGNHVAIVPKGRAGHEVRIEVGALATGANDDRDTRSGKERENVAVR